MNLAAVPPVQQVKQTKEQNINNLEKKKYGHQLNRSPTKSPTGKQNDDSMAPCKLRVLRVGHFLMILARMTGTPLGLISQMP